MAERDSKRRIRIFGGNRAVRRARHRQLAFVCRHCGTCRLLAISGPIATHPLPRIDSFIPTMFAIIFVSRPRHGGLLFAQFSATGLRSSPGAREWLSFFQPDCRWPFALTFPGAFAPTGLLGAGPQSAAWLNAFWRFGFATSIARLCCCKVRYADEKCDRVVAAICHFMERGDCNRCGLCADLCRYRGHEFHRLAIVDGKVLPMAHYANGVLATDESARPTASAGVDTRKIDTRSLADGCGRCAVGESLVAYVFYSGALHLSLLRLPSNFAARFKSRVGCAALGNNETLYQSFDFKQGTPARTCKQAEQRRSGGGRACP